MSTSILDDPIPIPALPTGSSDSSPSVPSSPSDHTEAVSTHTNDLTPCSSTSTNTVMDEQTFQKELQILKRRVNQMSARHQASPSAERHLSRDAFEAQLKDLKEHLASMQSSLKNRYGRQGPSPMLATRELRICSPSDLHHSIQNDLQGPQAVISGLYQNNLTLPSGPLFWQLFQSLRTDVRSVESRVATLERCCSDLEDRVDRIDPEMRTPAASTSSGDGHVGHDEETLVDVNLPGDAAAIEDDVSVVVDWTGCEVMAASSSREKIQAGLFDAQVTAEPSTKKALLDPATLSDITWDASRSVYDADDNVIGCVLDGEPGRLIDATLTSAGEFIDPNGRLVGSARLDNASKYVKDGLAGWTWDATRSLYNKDGKIIGCVVCGDSKTLTHARLNCNGDFVDARGRCVGTAQIHTEEADCLKSGFCRVGPLADDDHDSECGDSSDTLSSEEQSSPFKDTISEYPEITPFEPGWVDKGLYGMPPHPRSTGNCFEFITSLRRYQHRSGKMPNVASWLHGSAKQWYETCLLPSGKHLLDSRTLDEWTEALVARFAPMGSKAVTGKLESHLWSLEDGRKGKELLRDYAEVIVRDTRSEAVRDRISDAKFEHECIRKIIHGMDLRGLGYESWPDCDEASYSLVECLAFVRRVEDKVKSMLMQEELERLAHDFPSLPTMPPKKKTSESELKLEKEKVSLEREKIRLEQEKTKLEQEQLKLKTSVSSQRASIQNSTSTPQSKLDSPHKSSNGLHDIGKALDDIDKGLGDAQKGLDDAQHGKSAHAASPWSAGSDRSLLEYQNRCLLDQLAEARAGLHDIGKGLHDIEKGLGDARKGLTDARHGKSLAQMETSEQKDISAGQLCPICGCGRRTTPGPDSPLFCSTNCPGSSLKYPWPPADKEVVIGRPELRVSIPANERMIGEKLATSLNDVPSHLTASLTFKNKKLESEMKAMKELHRWLQARPEEEAQRIFKLLRTSEFTALSSVGAGVPSGATAHPIPANWTFEAEKQEMKNRILFLESNEQAYAQQLAESQRLLRYREEERESWEQRKMQVNEENAYLQETIREGVEQLRGRDNDLSNAEARIRDLQASLDQVLREKDDYREALTSRAQELQGLQGLCEDRGTLVQEQAQIIARGAGLMEEKDTEIERLTELWQKKDGDNRRLSDLAESRENARRDLKTLLDETDGALRKMARENIKLNRDFERADDEVLRCRRVMQEKEAEIMRLMDVSVAKDAEIEALEAEAKCRDVASDAIESAEPEQPDEVQDESEEVVDASATEAELVKDENLTPFAAAARDAAAGRPFKPSRDWTPRPIKDFVRLPHEERRAYMWEQGQSTQDIPTFGVPSTGRSPVDRRRKQERRSTNDFPAPDAKWPVKDEQGGSRRRGEEIRRSMPHEELIRASRAHEQRRLEEGRTRERRERNKHRADDGPQTHANEPWTFAPPPSCVSMPTPELYFPPPPQAPRQPHRARSMMLQEPRGAPDGWLQPQFGIPAIPRHQSMRELPRRKLQAYAETEGESEVEGRK